jgi:hypothetical protein
MSVSPTHTENKSGSGSQIIRVVIIPPKANMTAQPGDVNTAIPISTAITPAREAFQIVNPIHTPNAVARAFPPRKPRKGEKT